MSTTIYVLRLEGGHYYIGKSDNIAARYQQHLNGKGSAWTKKYPPVSLVTTIEGASPFDEDKITKEYMVKYGIDNVRGGSYVQIELSPFHMDALNMEIRGASDLCTQCGRAGHFVKDCYATTDVSGNLLEFEFESDSDDIYEYDDSDAEEDEEDDNRYDKPLTMKEQLTLRALEMQFKKSSITSSSVLQPRVREVTAVKPQRVVMYSYGSSSNDKAGYSSTITINGKTTSFGTKQSGVCYRCGRAGHYASECYAKTYVGRK
jgi:cellular nucleic acid-binding protein